MSTVDPEACIGCSACVNACPAGAIRLVEGKARIDQEKCTNCGKCIEICPVDAISK